MKFSHKYYFRPTPILIKKIADSVLAAVGGGGSVAALTNFHPQLGAIITVCAIVAKFISQCFTE